MPIRTFSPNLEAFAHNSISAPYIRSTQCHAQNRLRLVCLLWEIPNVRHGGAKRTFSESASNPHQITNIGEIHPPTSKSAIRETAANDDLGSKTNSVSDKDYEPSRSRVSIGNIEGNGQFTIPLEL